MTEPEVHLWRAVITQAITDASFVAKPYVAKRRGNPENEGKARSKKGAALRERDRARRWLTGNSRDFRFVCTLALLDPDAVRERALRKAAIAA